MPCQKKRFRTSAQRWPQVLFNVFIFVFAFIFVSVFVFVFVFSLSLALYLYFSVYLINFLSLLCCCLCITTELPLGVDWRFSQFSTWVSLTPLLNLYRMIFCLQVPRDWLWRDWEGTLHADGLGHGSHHGQPHAHLRIHLHGSHPLRLLGGMVGFIQGVF